MASRSPIACCPKMPRFAALIAALPRGDLQMGKEYWPCPVYRAEPRGPTTRCAHQSQSNRRISLCPADGVSPIMRPKGPTELMLDCTVSRLRSRGWSTPPHVSYSMHGVHVTPPGLAPDQALPLSLRRTSAAVRDVFTSMWVPETNANTSVLRRRLNPASLFSATPSGNAISPDPSST